MASNDQWLWGIHAGEKGKRDMVFLVQGYLALGWYELGDLAIIPPEREAFKEKLRATFPDNTDNSQTAIASELLRFVHDMRVGDPVAFRPTSLRDKADLVFLGKVTGPYLFNPYVDAVHPNLRRVEWQRSVSLSRFSDGARKELGGRQTLFKIDRYAGEFFAALAESK